MNELNAQNIHELIRDVAIFMAEREAPFHESIVALATLMCTIAVVIGAPKDGLLNSVSQTFDMIEARNNASMQ